MKKLRLLTSKEKTKKLCQLANFLEDACKLSHEHITIDGPYKRTYIDYIVTNNQFKAIKKLVKELYNNEEVKICV